jgi:hypothetical protein
LDNLSNNIQKPLSKTTLRNVALKIRKEKA